MAAKKTAIKKTDDSVVVADKHWFPEEAKTPTAATTPVKKTSPWQRRAAPVNYGTLAKPGISIKDAFNQHVDEKHKKLSDTQRDAVWKVVGNRMLSEPLNRLKDITDEAIKAHTGSK